MAVLIESFVSETLGLTKFPPYLPTFFSAFLSFLFIHQVIAPYFSARYFPVAFASKKRLARNTWSIHVVSQFHVLVVVPTALWCILHENPEHESNRAFGWDDKAGYVHAIACGYFLWDMLDSMINSIDSGFVAHGTACFMIYFMSFKPFVAYYGTRTLLWETSTFFLNNNWFLDKTGRTGGQLQLINAFFLVSTFFLVRIIYGGYISIRFFFTLLEVRHEIPLAYTIVYGGGNVLLQGLNWYWLFKIIAAIRRRFTNQPVERTKLTQENQNASTLSVNGNGKGHPTENRST
ncbi:hypothetical protein BYT27DRAFT_7188174 [Phlegmacium glaucopus]|nr:hypothetical protein BYT27DRAFT_7188174 [Phlegmacium glaucopus]